MDKKTIIEAVKKAKESSKIRKFKQTYDLIINLKDIDTKKVQINQFVLLPHSRGKKTKVCALVGPELLDNAKEICDGAVSVDEFDKYADKIKVKRLANEFDYFIAQATIMPKIATTFGRVLGPRGKMPNPKAGCVVPPNANLKPLYEKLQKTIKVQMKNSPILQCAVGIEGMNDEDVADNVISVFDSLTHVLPSTVHNIKNIVIKMTMGKPAKIEEIKEDFKEKAKEAKAKEEAPEEAKQKAPPQEKAKKEKPKK